MKNNHKKLLGFVFCCCRGCCIMFLYSLARREMRNWWIRGIPCAQSLKKILSEWFELTTANSLTYIATSDSPSDKSKFPSFVNDVKWRFKATTETNSRVDLMNPYIASERRIGFGNNNKSIKIVRPFIRWMTSLYAKIDPFKHRRLTQTKRRRCWFRWMGKCVRKQS